MKKFILFFFALVTSVCAFAQGTADFNTLEQTTKYAEYKTPNGWVATNCVVLVGHGGPATEDNNPSFAVFGEGNKAVCMNGKTSAVGKITSPVLEGGCGTLTFKYAHVYKETNGVNFTVAIVQNGETVASYDVVKSKDEIAQKEAVTWTEKVNVAGDFQIIFTDNCPTGKDGNADRYSIWDLSWTGKAAVQEGEVDFDKNNIAAINQADFVAEGKWYLLKQKRNGVSPVYDAGVGETMKRAANDKAVVAGMDAADAVNYLLRFIPASEGAYNIQFANGHYWASTTMTTTEEEPGEYNVYNINGEATHIGINKYDMENIVDNNGAGYTLAFWESGEVTKLDGNNDWTVWEVEFAEKSEAAAELKALVDEYEAAFNANNVVVEVGEGIITSTDQFSSEYTDEEEGSLANLLDGDGSTFWHSTWHHGNDTPMHVHYLQVEFPEPISGAFELNMNRRVNNGGMCQNDNPVKMSVEISLDGEEFVLADEFDTPFTQSGAAPLVQATVNIPTPAKYLRFFADECNGGSNRGYWHCGDFQLKPIVVPAPNAAYPEAAAAFAEALAAAKEAGANATGADVAALQAAYEAYLKGLQPAPAAPVYCTAAQLRENAEKGRFALLGVTATGDHYLNGEAGVDHVSADGTLAGVRDPEANEIVYLVKSGDQYLIQREDTKQFFQIAAGQNIVLVDDATAATPFEIYGKDDAGYPTGGFDDLFSDLEKAYDDYMIRFKANGQWLNTQGVNAIGGLRGGTGAWSFQYVRYMGEHEVVTPVEPEPTAVTFEFTDNEDGTITITPSDLKALYFFNIYSDRLNTEYQQGTDAEAIAGDVAQNLTAPEYEVHTGVSVVDPAEWLEYWFGGYVKYTEGDYRLGVVELAYNGTYSMGGEPVFHAFTKAAAEPEVKSTSSLLTVRSTLSPL